MKSNFFIVIIFLATAFIMTACPGAPQEVEVSKNTRSNQNAQGNQNTQVGQVNSNVNAPAAAAPQSNSPLSLPLPPNANIGNRPPAPTSTEKKIVPSGLTLENYNKIKPGMSYAEVVAIIGSEGELLSGDIKVAGKKSGLYKWGAKGTEMNISGLFQDDKLLTKNQFGLK